MFDACNGTGKLPGTDCRMNGFDQETGLTAVPTNPQYVYVPHNESKPYFDMAHEWVVADRMFQSQLDESFVAHQYIIAAQADASVDLPNGDWGCGGGPTTPSRRSTQDRSIRSEPMRPCFDYQTLGDELDDARTPWRFYTSMYGSGSSGDGGVWSSYQAVKHIYYGPDWKKDVITPNWKFIIDVRSRKTCELHLDHAGLRRLRSRRMRRRLRSVVGRGARQHGRKEQVLEFDGDLRAVGRLGRSLRSRPAAL